MPRKQSRKRNVRRAVAKRDALKSLSGEANAKMDPRIHGGPFGGEVLKGSLHERDQCAEARDEDPIRVETAMERRLRSLEESLKGLSYSVLHDAIPWRCEECGRGNRMLRHLAAYVSWMCSSCGCAVRDDYRRFHIDRNSGLRHREVLKGQDRTEPGEPYRP